MFINALVCFALLFFFRLNEAMVHKDLVDCIQKEQCGVFSVCSFSLTFEEPCVTGKNCSEDGASTGETVGETTVEGNIMLLRNGLDHIVDYTWNVVGYPRDSKADEAAPRKYVLPAFSYAYFDTGVPLYHTVRLVSGGETIDTESSSRRECTRHEACQYLLRTCHSSFVYVTTNTMNQKMNCLLYGKACGYFVNLPDLSSSSKNKDTDDGGDGSDSSFFTDVDGNGADDKTVADYYREGASACAVDCVWSWYPSKWLPTKPVLGSLVDSLDIIRRVHLGMSLDPRESKDVVFTDDKTNLFHTTEDDELLLMLNRDGGQKSYVNSVAIGWLSFFLVVTVLSMIALLSYVYYTGYYKKGRSLFGEVSSRIDAEDGNLDLYA